MDTLDKHHDLRNFKSSPEFSSLCVWTRRKTAITLVKRTVMLFGIWFVANFNSIQPKLMSLDEPINKRFCTSYTGKGSGERLHDDRRSPDGKLPRIPDLHERHLYAEDPYNTPNASNILSPYDRSRWPIIQIRFELCSAIEAFSKFHQECSWKERDTAGEPIHGGCDISLHG